MQHWILRHRHTVGEFLFWPAMTAAIATTGRILSAFEGRRTLASLVVLSTVTVLLMGTGQYLWALKTRGGLSDRGHSALMSWISIVWFACVCGWMVGANLIPWFC